MSTVPDAPADRLAVRADCFADPWTDVSTVVLQHGFCRNHRFWAGWLPQLGRQHRVLRPDLPGCGDSAGISAAGRDLAGLAELVGDAVAAASRQPVHYVGESLGGLIGVVLAATRPTLVASLTLVSTPLHIDPMVSSLQSLDEPSWPAAMRKYGMREWWLRSRQRMRYANPKELGASEPQDLWMAEQADAVSLESAVALAQAIETADVREFAPHVEQPVLVLVPEGSRYANRDSQLGHYDAFPQHRVELVTGAHHEMAYECSDVLAARVRRFVAGVEDASDG